jgi:hypothetical protein
MARHNRSGSVKGKTMVAHENVLILNATINRNMASKMLRAGFTTAEISEAFPEVWRNSEGKLSQRYCGNCGTDSHGRKETTHTILESVVDALIAAREVK